MKKTRRLGTDSSLTEWEWAALDKRFNLADGHAHLELPEESRLSLGDLNELFAAAEAPGQEQSEREFLDSFFTLTAQTLTLEPEPPLLHYSSSVSIEIVAKALCARGARTVALIAPTFDNIPMLLRRHGLELVPFSDEAWRDGKVDSDLLMRTDALFLVVPNNPTGTEPDASSFRRVMQGCIATRTVLVCDFSFRLYSQLSRWDQYATAQETDGLEWVFLEDTGKAWPARELKVGICSASATLAPLLERITDEVLLNVSPFTLGVLKRFIQCDQARIDRGGLPLGVDVVTRNRDVLRRALAESPLQAPAKSSLISVEWIGVPKSWRATKFCAWLDDQGLSLLPGSPFHWESSRGEEFVRIALMRDPEVFEAAAVRLAELARHYTRVSR